MIIIYYTSWPKLFLINIAIYIICKVLESTIIYTHTNTCTNPGGGFVYSVRESNIIYNIVYVCCVLVYI